MATAPEQTEVLQSFYRKIRPGGNGWEPIKKQLANQGESLEPCDSITTGVAAMCASTFLIYATLFGTGYLLYGRWLSFAASVLVAVAAGIILMRVWPRLNLGRVANPAD